MRANSKGKQYVSPVDGYVISIPPGAIPEGMTATFKHGIVPDGPFGSFKFPTGVRPVSAILSLHPTTEQPLLKPIDVALPHFIHCETQEDCQRLAVFKAKCTGDRGNGHGKQIYQFEQMTEVNLSLGTYYGDSKYPEGIPYAKYSTDHHCYLCIGEYRKEDIDKAIFSMIEVKPKVVDQFDNLVVHFCLPYFLPTCHQVRSETCIMISIPVSVTVDIDIMLHTQAIIIKTYNTRNRLSGISIQTKDMNSTYSPLNSHQTKVVTIL